MKLLKKTTHKEQGRSMVEMLGVLAIIGVLSIGGIAGYTMAMNRHKANQILDIASKMSVMVRTVDVETADNWNSLVDDMFAEVGVQGHGDGYSGSIEHYEATVMVYDDGNVDIYSPNNGIYNALKSITGNENPGITVN